jgi:hypothetical protein
MYSCKMSIVFLLQPNVTITLLDIVYRPVFYLELNSTQLYRFVCTSQETYYVAATSPTG